MSREGRKARRQVIGRIPAQRDETKDSDRDLADEGCPVSIGKKRFPQLRLGSSQRVNPFRSLPARISLLVLTTTLVPCSS